MYASLTKKNEKKELSTQFYEACQAISRTLVSHRALSGAHVPKTVFLPEKDIASHYQGCVRAEAFLRPEERSDERGSLLSSQ
jgi:hypothetical protein